MKVIIQLVHCSDSVFQTLTKNIESMLAEDNLEGMECTNILTKEKQKEFFIIAAQRWIREHWQMRLTF